MCAGIGHIIFYECEPINELLSGVELLAHELKSDEEASQKIQVMIIKCGGDAEVITDWTDAENFNPISRRHG